MTNFEFPGLPNTLIQALLRQEIKVPTPIQKDAIPVALEGHDILASAQTGTGKTVAYLLPLLTHVLQAPSHSALIVAPTRELAMQVFDMAQKLLGKKSLCHIALLIGGEPMFRQFSALKRNPQIVVGTPGRINDHLARRSLTLYNTQFLVLDETDRLLDMGFSEDLDNIVDHLPEDRQTLMFSATIPKSIESLSRKYLNQPKRIAVGSTSKPIAKIKQESIQTTHANKFTLLLKELEVREGSMIIFVKTKVGVDKLADKLRKEDFRVNLIHGDLKQRQRTKEIKSFREGGHILVATDVAARGIDIPSIRHVINYDLPQCPSDYIHRIGRTGRAGMEGEALSFVSPDEQWLWRNIHKLITNDSGKEVRQEKAPKKFNKKKRFMPERQHGKSTQQKRKLPSRKRQGMPTRSHRTEKVY